MTATPMTEDQAVNLVRNALLVAGHEMGPDGDHWPVIKSTIHTIMQDWENLKIERNVFEELRTYYGDIVACMEKNLELCPTDLRPRADTIVKEAREAYEACFADTDLTMFVVCDSDMPIHIKRADGILETLEDDHG